MFDNKTIELIGSYVYALFHPNENIPFYLGKGVGNRVFDHKWGAIKTDVEGLKLDKIRQLRAEGLTVKHIILRHGLTDKEAIEVESTVIDLGNHLGWNLTNKVEGHHTYKSGLMTTDEIIRVHNAKKLESLEHPVMLININKKYKRANSSDSIYEATKEAWVVGGHRRRTVKYALAEYTGIIVEVFKITEWYPVVVGEKTRWGFNGEVASKDIRDIYVNMSVAHTKAKGAANPIKYVLKDYTKQN